MPQLQPLCSASQVPNVLPRGDEGSGKPCAVIEALWYISPTQDSNPGGMSGDYYTATVHWWECVDDDMKVLFRILNGRY